MSRRSAAPEVVLVRGDTVLACWPLLTRDRPALEVVDELARLQLVARRLGWSIRLRDAGADLMQLVELVGLADVVGG